MSLGRLLAWPLIVLAGLWRYGCSGLLPPSCRYIPSCSAYAMTAWQRHGIGRGSALVVRRLCRCHPWGGQGYDPVPKRRE